MVPEPHCVLGTMLRPFSVGHVLLLKKIKSPFAARIDERLLQGDLKRASLSSADIERTTSEAWQQLFAETSEYDIAVATFICAARYGESLHALIAGEWPERFDAWYRQVRPGFFSRNRFNYADERDKLAAYLRAGQLRPPLWRHDLPGNIEITSPEECLLIARLVDAGFNEADVMEKYLPAAWYLYYSACELWQASNAKSPKDWRRTFYTQQHHDMGRN